MNDSTPLSGGGLPTPVIAALHRVLQPLVRLLLSNGIHYQAFCNLVKSVYVKVAEEEFRLADKTQTDSRISLLTGLQRRDVKKLREEPVTETNLPQQASMSALLLTIWSGHPEYLDENGTPLPLPRLASKGGERSFEGLVQSISKDFRARVVLDEWLRQGIAVVDGEDRVHLTDEAFASPQGIEEKSFYFGQNIHDHLAAIVHNLAGDEPPFLERCVYYNRLTPESVAEFAAFAKAAGMKALHSVNKHAAELQKRDRGQANATCRANFGIYNFSDAEDKNEPPTH